MNLIPQEVFITNGRKKPHGQVRDTLKKFWAHLNGSNNKRKPKKLLTKKTDFLILCFPLECSQWGILNLVFLLFHLKVEYFWWLSWLTPFCFALMWVSLGWYCDWKEVSYRMHKPLLSFREWILYPDITYKPHVSVKFCLYLRGLFWKINN